MNRGPKLRPVRHGATPSETRARPTPPQRRRSPYRTELLWLTALVLVVAGLVIAVEQVVFNGSSSSNGTQGSGTAATETRHVAPFSKLDLAGSNNVTVRVGGRRSVVVHADDNLLDTVTTRVNAGRLVIGTTGSFTTKAPMRVDVTVPSLRKLTLSGSGTLAADNIRVRRLTVTLSGSGIVRASGTADRLDVSLTGSGNAHLGQLVARDVHAVLMTSGVIVVDATNSLDAAMRGSGVILYSGNPAHVTQSVTGSGVITGT